MKASRAVLFLRLTVARLVPHSAERSLAPATAAVTLTGQPTADAAVTNSEASDSDREKGGIASSSSGGGDGNSSGSGSGVRTTEPPRASRPRYVQPGLENLHMAAYAPATGSPDDAVRGRVEQAVAMGTVIAQLSDSVFSVSFADSCLLPFVDVGARVYTAYDRLDGEAGTGSSPYLLMGGSVVKVNSNGTFGVLLDNNKLDLAVPRDRITLVESIAHFMERPEFLAVVAWLRSAGLTTLEEQQSTASVLYQRGWRAHRLYLLESSDVSQLTHLSKCARMSLAEKAEWQRDHHRQMRTIYKERVKEKDWRHFCSKYAGILSATVAFIGAGSLFGWNYKNYLKQQRSHQMRFAVKSLCRPVLRKESDLHRTSLVPRDAEEAAISRVLRQLDTAHPRIAVFTGLFGCGKSTLLRMAMSKEKLTGVIVDVRTREDTLRCVIKALGVPYVDACGDPLDFVAEACVEASRQMGGKIPVIVLKLREGDNLSHVYNEAVSLACDRRVCHLLIEVPLESLTLANTSLPRLDFYTVPNFNMQQAYQYTQHSIDPVELAHFFEVMGTNSNALDELFAAVHQRGLSTSEYANHVLLKSMRQIQVAVAGRPDLRECVKRLAQYDYDDGQKEGLDDPCLSDPLLKDIALYDPVRDVWLFNSAVLCTAARCCFL